MRTIASWLGSTESVAEETPTKLMSTIAATVATKIRKATEGLWRRYSAATDVRTVLRRRRIEAAPPRRSLNFWKKGMVGGGVSRAGPPPHHGRR